jgi:hypothetical protein
MKTYWHLWAHLVQLFLERGEIFQTKVVEKIKTRFMFSKLPPPPPENRAFNPLPANVENIVSSEYC